MGMYPAFFLVRVGRRLSLGSVAEGEVVVCAYVALSLVRVARHWLFGSAAEEEALVGSDSPFFLARGGAGMSLGNFWELEVMA